MIDGSMLPFEENVAISKKVADAAHAVGLSVEAELGTIGQTDGEAEDGSDAIIYTDPDDAVTFVERRAWTASLSPSAPPTASTRRP